MLFFVVCSFVVCCLSVRGVRCLLVSVRCSLFIVLCFLCVDVGWLLFVVCW